MSDKGAPSHTESTTEPALDIQSLKRRSVGGAVSTAGSQGIRFLTSVVSQVVLARLLSPEQFGLVAMVAPVIGFIGLFASLGLLQPVVQSPTITQGQLSSLFWVNVLAGLVLSIVAACSAPILAIAYHEPKILPITIALSIPIAVSGLSMLQFALMNRHLRFTSLAAIEVVLSLVSVGLTIGLAVAGFGVWSLVWGQVATPVLSGLLVWMLSSWRPNAPRIDPEIRGMLRSGFHISASNMLGFFNSSFDNMLIGVVRGKTELGFYDRAWRFVVVPLGQIQAPFGRVAVPLLSRLVEDVRVYRLSYIRITHTMLLISTPGLLTVLVADRQIVLAALGARWLPIAPVIWWVTVGALITPVNSTLFWLLQSQGRTQEQLRWGGGAMFLNILSYLAGISWGVVGVARTSAISVYLLQTPFLIWAITRSGPVDLTTVVRCLGVFVLPTAVTALCVAGFMMEFSQPTIVRILGSFLVAYGSFVACLIPFASGRALLREAWEMRRLIRR